MLGHAVGEPHSEDPLPGGGGDCLGNGGEGVGGVVAESLDAQQASVGGKPTCHDATRLVSRLPIEKL